MPPPAASAAGQAAHPAAPPAAYVYSGPGAGSRSVQSTIHSLREALVPAVQVASLDTNALLAGGWQAGCLLLVMPGGADLPYCRHLNGRGNALIRAYVEGGGAYLGLCAGAYYACARVEFEPGTEMEVVGDRELAFFPGTAAGGVYPGFCYESECGSVPAPLRFLEPPAGEHVRSEGLLEGSSSSSSSSSRAATWQQCVDYVSGGPRFVLRDGSPLAPALEACRQQEQQQQQHKQQQEQQQRQERAALARVELLATYCEHEGAAAALRCWVGSSGGRAVLCGSHPELHPAWLSGGVPPAGTEPRPVAAAMAMVTAGAVEGAGSPATAAYIDSVSNRAAAVAAAAAAATGLASSGHVERLQAALLRAQPQRWRFWRSLLAAAGLEGYLQQP